MEETNNGEMDKRGFRATPPNGMQGEGSESVGSAVGTGAQVGSEWVMLDGLVQHQGQ